MSSTAAPSTTTKAVDEHRADDTNAATTTAKEEVEKEDSTTTEEDKKKKRPPLANLYVYSIQVRNKLWRLEEGEAVSSSKAAEKGEEEERPVEEIDELSGRSATATRDAQQQQQEQQQEHHHDPNGEATTTRTTAVQHHHHHRRPPIVPVQELWEHYILPFLYHTSGADYADLKLDPIVVLSMSCGWLRDYIPTHACSFELQTVRTHQLAAHLKKRISVAVAAEEAAVKLKKQQQEGEEAKAKQKDGGTSTTTTTEEGEEEKTKKEHQQPAPSATNDKELSDLRENFYVNIRSANPAGAKAIGNRIRDQGQLEAFPLFHVTHRYFFLPSYIAMLHHVISEGDDEVTGGRGGRIKQMLDYLIEDGWCDVDNEPLVRYATQLKGCRATRLKVVRHLVEHHKCSVNVCGLSDGVSALHAAIIERDPVMAQYLLEHGADAVNIRTKRAWSTLVPLHSNCLDLLQFAVDGKIDHHLPTDAQRICLQAVPPTKEELRTRLEQIVAVFKQCGHGDDIWCIAH